MKPFLLGSLLVAINTIPSHAQSEDNFQQNLDNANDVYRQQQQQQQQQNMQRQNTLNGTSQYSGPICYTSANGNRVCGYQKSTP